MNALRIASSTQRIIIDEGTKSVSVVLSGPPGPPGPPGANGTAISFEYTQATPASSHVVNHNLGYKPNYMVEEYTTGADITCSVIHHTINQLELQFNTPRAIVAHLS